MFFKFIHSFYRFFFEKLIFKFALKISINSTNCRLIIWIVTISIWQHILLDAKCLTLWQRHRILLIILETYVISCFINSIFVNYNIYYSSFFKFLTQYYLFELLAIATIISKSKFFRRLSRWWCSNDFNVQYYIVEFASLLSEVDYQSHRLRATLRLRKIQRHRLHRRITIETTRRWEKYKTFA